jgi:hypothetical protein
MYIAKVENNFIIETGMSSGIFPNVSFPNGEPDLAWLAAQDYYPIVSHSYDPNTQKLVSIAPTFSAEAQEVYIDEVVELTPEEIAERQAAALQAKRAAMIVTPYQAKVVLLDEGQLDEVEAAVVAATDPKIKLAWTNAIHYERLSPLIAEMQAAIGWSDEDLDMLFEAAALVQ